MSEIKGAPCTPHAYFYSRVHVSRRCAPGVRPFFEPVINALNKTCQNRLLPKLCMKRCFHSEKISSPFLVGYHSYESVNIKGTHNLCHAQIEPQKMLSGHRRTFTKAFMSVCGKLQTMKSWLNPIINESIILSCIATIHNRGNRNRNKASIVLFQMLFRPTCTSMNQMIRKGKCQNYQIICSISLKLEWTIRVILCRGVIM